MCQTIYKIMQSSKQKLKLQLFHSCDFESYIKSQENATSSSWRVVQVNLIL